MRNIVAPMPMVERSIARSKYPSLLAHALCNPAGIRSPAPTNFDDVTVCRSRVIPMAPDTSDFAIKPMPLRNARQCFTIRQVSLDAVRMDTLDRRVRHQHLYARFGDGRSRCAKCPK